MCSNERRKGQEEEGEEDDENFDEPETYVPER